MTAAAHRPDWPAMMAIETAAAYCDMSETSFRILATLSGVRPRDCAGLALARWRRADLDAMIDSLGERGGQSGPALPESPSPAAAAADVGDLALERVRRGVRR